MISRILRRTGLPLVSAVLGLLAAAPLVSQDTPTDGERIDVRRGFVGRSFESALPSGDPISLPYRLFVPESVENETPLPVVLLLHGEPLRGDDNIVTLRGLALRFQSATREERAVLIVPQCPTGRAWTAGPESETLLAVLHSLTLAVEVELTERGRPVDPDRRYVCGQGIGADAALSLAVAHPSDFAAVVASNAGRSTGGLDGPAPDCPCWLWHGSLDPLVPVERARAFARRAHAEDRPLLYSEWTNGGHVVWPNALTNDLALGWLLRSSRSTTIDEGLLVESTGSQVTWRDPRVVDRSRAFFRFDPEGATGITRRVEDRFVTPTGIASSLDGSSAAIAYREGGIVLLQIVNAEVTALVTERERTDDCALLSGEVLLASDADSGRIDAYRALPTLSVDEVTAVDLAGASGLAVSTDGRQFWCAGEEGIAAFVFEDDSIRRVASKSWPSSRRPANEEVLRLVRAGSRLFALHSGAVFEGSATGQGEAVREIPGPDSEHRVEDLSVTLDGRLVARIGDRFAVLDPSASTWTPLEFPATAAQDENAAPETEVVTPAAGLRRFWR